MSESEVSLSVAPGDAMAYELMHLAVGCGTRALLRLPT